MPITPYYKDESTTLYLGDCLEVMKGFEPGQIDTVISDLPYGTTANRWDSILPLGELWESYERVAKSNAAFVLTASQPFTSTLVQSNVKKFRHEWIWIKNRGSNFANTVREPMKEHESVLVFSAGKWTYNRQMQPRTGTGADRVKYEVSNKTQSENYAQFEGRAAAKLPEMRVPSSWQKFNTQVGLHPTQKPLALMEYLVLTYSDPGQVILDNCAGSGTTLLAARNLGRRSVGIELEEKYCEVIANRLSDRGN